MTRAATANSTVFVGSLDGNGTITDSSDKGATTTLDVHMAGASPCLFAGVIEDGPVSGSQPQKVGLSLDWEGLLTLTGHNTYSGGTEIWDGWVQVGDGNTNGSMITGPVADDTTGGLIFDVAAQDTETFNGVIYTANGMWGDGYGSVVKTGPGRS